MSPDVVYPLPDAAQVGSLLGMLFDGLAVKPGPKLDLSNGLSHWTGVYVDDANIPVAMCACDIAFAAHGGAALSMLPPKMAADAIKSRELTPAMAANLSEILNICTRLLLRDGTPHLRLGAVSTLSHISTEASRWLTEAKRRVDFSIQLGKYGTGGLTVLLA